MDLVKYCLKSDRAQIVQVESPIFSTALVIDSKGKKTEVPRHEFMEKYEPLVAVTMPAPDMAPDRAPSGTAQALARIEAKIDELLAFVKHEPGGEEKPAQ